MFGTVTSGMIADQLKTQFDVTLEKRKIQLEHPIRVLGDHEIELRLHQDVVTTSRCASRVPRRRPHCPPSPPRKPGRTRRRPKSAVAVLKSPTERLKSATRSHMRQEPSGHRDRRRHLEPRSLRAQKRLQNLPRPSRTLHMPISKAGHPWPAFFSGKWVAGSLAGMVTNPELAGFGPRVCRWA